MELGIKGFRYLKNFEFMYFDIWDMEICGLRIWGFRDLGIYRSRNLRIYEFKEF